MDGDRSAYLTTLRTQCEKYGTRILGYCLMTNHVHLILVPEEEDALNWAVGRTHFIYSQYVNRLHERSGHLWQGRFYSCPMDEAHALTAMRYIERNPVRARITRVPWTYPWSSAVAHIGGMDPLHLLDLPAWNDLAPDVDWKELLSEDEEAETVEELRLHTHTGRPLADDAFITKLEHMLGRRLRALPVGRPRKRKEK